jgi:hypothetical protein
MKSFSRRTFLLLIASTIWIICGAAAQDVRTWQRSTVDDPLRKTSFIQFILQGKYLKAPKNQKADELPALVVRCSGKPHNLGKFVMNGRFLAGYLVSGTVVNSQVVVHDGLLGTTFPVIVPVLFRLDEGKLQQQNWHTSTDNSSAFFDELTLNTLLYGHYLPHKENTNEQVHKVIIGLDEAFAGEVQIEFDLPDVTEVAEACGVVMHKK